MLFSLFLCKIDAIKSMFERKIELLDYFQRGIDIWKIDDYKKFIPVNSYRPSPIDILQYQRMNLISNDIDNEKTTPKDNILSAPIKLSEPPAQKRDNIMNTNAGKLAIENETGGQAPCLTNESDYIK